jgi:hypothetical protein
MTTPGQAVVLDWYLSLGGQIKLLPGYEMVAVSKGRERNSIIPTKVALTIVITKASAATWGKPANVHSSIKTLPMAGFPVPPKSAGAVTSPTVTAVIPLINFFLLLIAPMADLLWVSLLPFYQNLSTNAFRLLTLNNYRTVCSRLIT